MHISSTTNATAARTAETSIGPVCENNATETYENIGVKIKPSPESSRLVGNMHFVQELTKSKAHSTKSVSALLPRTCESREQCLMALLAMHENAGNSAEKQCLEILNTEAEVHR